MKLGDPLPRRGFLGLVAATFAGPALVGMAPASPKGLCLGPFTKANTPFLDELPDIEYRTPPPGTSSYSALLLLKQQAARR